MLEIAASGLQELLHQVTFVGGTIASFYATHPAPTEPRPTFDVDCVIEITSQLQFVKLEERLRNMGLEHDTSENAPICRWKFRGVSIDIMPDNPKILGFASIWSAEGLKAPMSVTLHSGVSIRILTAPYYFASKLEAFLGRGVQDIRISGDFEDIVYVLDNRSELTHEIADADIKLKHYVSVAAQSIQDNPSVQEAVDAALGFGFERRRASAIINLISGLAELK